LADAPVIERIVRDRVRITCTYAQLEGIRNAVHAHEGEVLHSDFSDVVILSAALPRSVIDQLLQEWSTHGIMAARAVQEK